MQINREIIIDLLPLYLAGDVSNETRKVIEQHLADDPKLQLLLTEMQQTSPLTEIPIPLNEEHEMKTLQKIKRLTLQHNLFLSLALFFSLSFFVGILLLNVNDDWGSAVAGSSFLMAALFWTAFRNANRQLNQIE
jgi:hypothetical protein